jgi:hypothetical protein
MTDPDPDAELRRLERLRRDRPSMVGIRTKPNTPPTAGNPRWKNQLMAARGHATRAKAKVK